MGPLVWDCTSTYDTVLSFRCGVASLTSCFKIAQLILGGIHLLEKRKHLNLCFWVLVHYPALIGVVVCSHYFFISIKEASNPVDPALPLCGTAGVKAMLCVGVHCESRDRACAGRAMGEP